MKYLLNITYLLIISVSAIFGQGELRDQPKMLFHNEQTVGLFLNSNGIGADYRFARFINARNDRIYEISFDYVKHPKEYKSVVPYEWYTKRFVYGKENLFWELKVHYGNQYELYRKYDFSSISIRLVYSGGLSLGFLKPIYYDILSFDGSGRYTLSEVKKFDPAIHLYNYGGNASFTKGFDELKVTPGLTFSAGFLFEYSEREPMIHALETGVGFTIYPRQIRIMATEDAQYYFFKLHVGYRFGNMIDISGTAKAKTWQERRKERKESMDKSRQPAINIPF
ncbi:MAG: hypothetical protein WD578_06095 [Bacteroidales bacterium]